MNAIELTRAVGSTPDAGYLRLEFSAERGAYYVDIVSVRPAFRRQGIASGLLQQAADMLGYTPEPEAIIPSAQARGFWGARGYKSGFNQSKLEV